MILVLMALRSNTFGQTYALPDTNFRNVLIAKYPSVMTGDKLNIAVANSFLFDLIIPNANISDLSGVQYFTSIYKLDASNNQITTVPDLSGLKNLGYLYLNHNQLTNVNFMIGCTNLLQLQLFNNKLTSFPELSGFTRLQVLALAHNQIKWMTGLPYLTDLRYLHIGTNLFDSLPDISQNITITELHCDRNNLKALNGIENLVNLNYLDCLGNQITDLASLNSITALQVLYANDNLLTSLPVLTNKPLLSKLFIDNNKLTFEDLLPVTSLTGLVNFTYAPQDSVGAEVNYNLRTLDDVTLSPVVDAGVSSNVYAWYKDNGLLSNTSRDFIINKAQLSDAGNYRVEITNPALPLLKLVNRSWIVTINSKCAEVAFYGYKILNKDCKDGTEIQFELSLNGAQLPFVYSFKYSDKEDSIVSSLEIISNIPAGIYSLAVTDQRGCRIIVDPNLEVHRPADCEPVIAPLGNGPLASYFIESKGLVRILDLKGNIVRELNAPAVWDGTNSDGSLVDFGYYVITVNNKKLTNITVVR